MINKIGIQNFRVFKEFTEFEIKPITLLVGPNNAGKSSFTKLLLLLLNGIEKLNFEEGAHNLDSFDKVINWESTNKAMKIRYDNKLEFLDNSFFTDVIYSLPSIENEMMAINISNGRDQLLTFAPYKSKKSDTPVVYRLNFNINLMINLIYNNDTTSFLEVDDNRDLNWRDDDDDEHEMTFYEGDLSLDNFENIYKESGGYLDCDGSNHVGKIVLKHEIRKLEKDYLLYEVFIKGENATLYYKDKIIELQNLEFSQIDYSPNDFLLNVLDDCLHIANNTVKWKIEEYFATFLNEKDIVVKETKLGRLLLTEKLFETSNNTNTIAFSMTENIETNYQKTFFQQFSNFSKGLSEDFGSIEYISANRGSQKRILKNNSDNDIDKIVLDFFKTSDKNILYVKKVFEILEIPGKLTVERFENVISVVYLTINGRKVALSDVGFGYSQLIPIILKIATYTTSEYKSSNLYDEKEWEKLRGYDKHKDSNIIIIEEPEANLHPNLQSKLADMLVATIEYYPSINFVIETHSEYLIRKLQFLTAKKTITSNQSIIYYFNADKHVTATEPKVKAIEITSNGNLTDTFGPGFYDEATHLQFQLMKLNQEQSN